MMLNYNSKAYDIGDSLDNDRYRLEAFFILTSHVEEISQYYFDEASTDTTAPADISGFSQNGDLGFDANDAGFVDDIDDLKGVTLADTGRSGVVYQVAYEVNYAKKQGNQIVRESVGRTYHKQVRLHIFEATLLH